MKFIATLQLLSRNRVAPPTNVPICWPSLKLASMCDENVTCSSMLSTTSTWGLVSGTVGSLSFAKRHEVYRAYLSTCKRWLTEIGPQSAKALKRLVIHGPHLGWWTSDPVLKVLALLQSARKIEQALFQSASLSTSIYSTFTYEMMLSQSGHSQQQICKSTIEGCLDGCRRFALTLPATDMHVAREEVEKAFAEREDRIRSRSIHGCLVSSCLPELLQSVEFARERTMVALERLEHWRG